MLYTRKEYLTDGHKQIYVWTEATDPVVTMETFCIFHLHKRLHHGVQQKWSNVERNKKNTPSIQILTILPRCMYSSSKCDSVIKLLLHAQGCFYCLFEANCLVFHPKIPYPKRSSSQTMHQKSAQNWTILSSEIQYQRKIQINQRTRKSARVASTSSWWPHLAVQVATFSSAAPM